MISGLICSTEAVAEACRDRASCVHALARLTYICPNEPPPKALR